MPQCHSVQYATDNDPSIQNLCLVVLVVAFKLSDTRSAKNVAEDIHP